MSKHETSLPRDGHFFMPGEHHPQEAVWMAWPMRSDNWRLGGKPAQAVFCQIAQAIAESTPVVMLVQQEQYANARAQLPHPIQVIEMSYNDSWMRDIGATYLINHAGKRCGVSWQFNAWGGLSDGLYFPWDLDDMVAEKMVSLTQDPLYCAPFVLEGGSIHCDGEGTLYTTEECLLHPSRNPDQSKPEIEQRLKDYLGIEKVIWLPQGLFNDETNGHVDNLMHVVKPGEVILTWCDNPNDPQYAISQAAYTVLSQCCDAKGRSLKIHKIPLPGPLYMGKEEAEGIDWSQGMKRAEGERLGASYANFLITNDRIIFPLLCDQTDAQAQAVLERAFPHHTVVGIPTREVVLGGGNIHCITQQIPLPITSD